MKANPSRRRFQFRLRTLFVFMTLVCCGAGWLSFRLRQGRQQRDAVNTVERLGGSVSYDYENVSMHFGPRLPKPGPEWLRNLLGDEFFTEPDGFFHIGESATDDDLVLIGTQKRLQFLELSGTRVTDEGLIHLQALSDLYRLTLSGTQIGGEGLWQLRRLRKLGFLDLTDTQVTDEALRNLCPLVRLDRLELSGTQVTDAGVADLRPLTRLSCLFLNNTQVSDEGLLLLRGQRHLTFLAVRGTKVTAQGCRELQAAMPGLEIDR